MSQKKERGLSDKFNSLESQQLMSSLSPCIHGHNQCNSPSSDWYIGSESMFCAQG